MANYYFYIPTSQDAWKQYTSVYPELTKYGSTSHFNSFTHAYVSARLAQIYGQEAAKFLGNSREFFGIGNSDASHRHDLFNNMIGRDLVKNHPNLSNLSPSDIAKLIKDAADSGKLALNNQDPRLNTEIPDDYWSLSKIKDFFEDILKDLFGNAEFGDKIKKFLDEMFGAESAAALQRLDPLALDLDGDGVETVHVNNSSAFFDLDLKEVGSLVEANDIKNNPQNANYNPNALIYTSSKIDANGNNITTYYIGDGLKEKVGWVKGDDGLLVLDRNNNGLVDNILELFGKASKTGTEEFKLADFNQQKQPKRLFLSLNGHERSESQRYNLNNDGVINSSDAVFSKLQIWQDLNQDDISENNELKTLSDLKITKINVNDTILINQVL